MINVICKTLHKIGKSGPKDIPEISFEEVNMTE